MWNSGVFSGIADTDDGVYCLSANPETSIAKMELDLGSELQAAAAASLKARGDSPGSRLAKHAEPCKGRKRVSVAPTALAYQDYASRG